MWYSNFKFIASLFFLQWTTNSYIPVLLHKQAFKLFTQNASKVSNLWIKFILKKPAKFKIKPTGLGNKHELLSINKNLPCRYWGLSWNQSMYSYQVREDIFQKTCFTFLYDSYIFSAMFPDSVFISSPFSSPKLLLN